MESATTVKSVNNINSKSESKVKIPVRIYVAFLMLFLFFAAFMVEATGSALVIQQNQLANQGVLSTEIAIAGLIGAVISMCYSRIYKLLHSFTPVVSTIGGIIGFIICSSASNMIIFFIGLIFMMISSLIIPYVYDTILSDVDTSISNLIISIAQVCNNLGAFASPFVISFLAKMMNVTTPVDQMRISAGILTVITIIFLGIALTGQHARKHVSI